MEIHVPGREMLRLEHLALDYNGTIACDGILLDGVAERLIRLGKSVSIHVLTADTFGSVHRALENIACRVSVIPVQSQAQAKWEYVRSLGFEKTVCMGNGRNDVLMLKDAALSVAVIQTEGCFVGTLLAAQIAVRHILDALDLLLNPLRLQATLRQ